MLSASAVGGSVSEVMRSLSDAAVSVEDLEYSTTAGKKHAVKKVLVEPEPGLGKHAAQFIGHRLVGEGTPEYILLGILETGSVIGKASISGLVISLPVDTVSEHTVSFIYFLEFFFGLLLSAGVGIRVVFEGKLPEGPFYIFMAGVLRDA